MNKVSLIIQREYLTRVKKKSFIVMTLIGPILIGLLMLAPILIDKLTESDPKVIAVLDESNAFFDKFKENDNTKFKYVFGSLESQKDSLLKGDNFALLYIPKTQVSLPSKAIIYSEKQVPFQTTDYIKGVMKREIESIKLSASGIDPSILQSIKANVDISTLKINEAGEEQKSFSAANYALGYAGGFLIYIFIFMFGAQVMRGVMEEKTNRIVEVIVSSIKPFQLMMGKIIGICLVGLTQFILWIVFSFVIYLAVTHFVSFGDMAEVQSTTGMMVNPEVGEMTNSLTSKVFEIIDSIPIASIILSFLFYFVFGYLIYGALFAAIGSAVDNEADTQQFMLPITIPLIISIISISAVMNNPQSNVGFWLSMFPLTSPVVMMARIPFGVSTWELIVSMVLMVVGFVAVTWLAGKIYRTGILMYGKKVSYKELWKWIKYKS
ncbi:MAG: ABC transporter permease [Hyphomicrobiales bacterium]